MHGDFTRSGFIPTRRYSAVLQQQGRVQLDADWNTLVAIVSDQLRGALADVIGWHGTPTEETGDGFLVELDADREDFTIGPGRYYEVSPESRYRGLENQLYRVEIRDPEDASDATFVWSRNNGSEVFAVRDRRGDGLVVKGLGRDQVADLKEGDWVEVLDDGLALAGEPGDLRKVSEVDPLDGVVLLDGPVAFDSARHPFVRRWDSDGAVDVAAGAEFPDGWIPLEDGVEARFSEGWFRTGDYWQVPARTSGRLEWPPDPDGPSLVPPSGIMHHYAPLACLTDGASPADRRRKFARLQP